ncbi:MAG: FecR family protein [Rhodospirillales bacterium]
MKFIKCFLIVVIGAAAILFDHNPALSAEKVGTVQFVRVYAYGTPPEGKRQGKFKRDVVFLNEVLETVRTGGLKVAFIDGTELIMGSNTVLKIDDFVYEPGAQQEKSSLNLAVGVFLYVSGKMKKEGVTLETPTATIGIRGTELAISVAASGETTVGVISGLAEVTSKRSGSSERVGRGKSVSVGEDGGLSGVTKGVKTTNDPDIDKDIPFELRSKPKKEKDKDDEDSEGDDVKKKEEKEEKEDKDEDRRTKSDDDRMKENDDRDRDRDRGGDGGGDGDGGGGDGGGGDSGGGGGGHGGGGGGGHGGGHGGKGDDD